MTQRRRWGRQRPGPTAPAGFGGPACPNVSATARGGTKCGKCPSSPVAASGGDREGSPAELARRLLRRWPNIAGRGGCAGLDIAPGGDGVPLRRPRRLQRHMPPAPGTCGPPLRTRKDRDGRGRYPRASVRPVEQHAPRRSVTGEPRPCGELVPAIARMRVSIRASRRTCSSPQAHLGACPRIRPATGSSQPTVPGANWLRASCEWLSGHLAPSPALAANVERSGRGAAVTPLGVEA